jgi:long-chain acyl-CoA synthetase
VNLAALLAYHALGRPRHPAIIEPERTICHAELDLLVRRSAAWLRRQGIAAGSLVGLRLADTAEHLIHLLALARLGAVVLPLDWRWTPAEIGRVTERFPPRLVLGEAQAELLSDIVQVAPGASWRQVEPDPAPPQGGADTPFLVSLSSGTTGAPRGPTITHGEMMARFMTQWVSLSFHGADRYLCATPLYFGAGRSFCLSHLVAGATVCLLAPPFEPTDLLEAVARWQPSVMFLVPTLLRRLLPLASDAGLLLGGVRVLVSSGSAMQADERAEILARLTPNLFDYYASTEGGGISVLAPADQLAHADTVGRPAFAVEIEVVDGGDNPLPAGQVGRLRYRGPGVASDRGDGARRPDGWFYPGDLAARDEDGFIVLKGRATEMIIRGGVNIFPSEIEQVLLAHPGVREAAVVGQPSRARGEEVAAFVVAGTMVTESALRRHCENRLAPYKQPRIFLFRSELPKSGLGKILKDRLAASLETLP